ncbi:MAG: DEAD/DEAH box helicase [Thaumarchaeota archaeon]|nr:DEAD/DEAH box helicase [Nitrososphaerota archaeon]
MTEHRKDIFSSFTKPIQRALKERGFTTPTQPQTAAIPHITQNKNILLIAPTGTGKTEAAILPVLNALQTMTDKPRGIKVLYITPLRALNRDLLERLQWWCKILDIRLAVRHGDTETAERGKQALAPPDILITTPETLQAILPGKVMKKHLSEVRWIVVDEVHELAGEKRGSQLSLALERLRLLTQREFQIIGLSATIGTPERVASFLVGEGRPCEVIDVAVHRQVELEVVYPRASVEDLELASKLYTHPEAAARLNLIKKTVENHRSSLVFTNTRSEAEILANRFRLLDMNYPLGIHHGSLSKTSRIATERGLKEGRLSSIICTSSLELGIDIGQLDLVIQYNSPRQVTRLLQRVGRSGHKIGGVSKGVIITQDSDDALESMVIGRRALVGLLEPVDMPDKPYEPLVHQMVGLLLQKARWYVEEALELFAKAYPYRSLVEEDLEKVLKYMHERYPRLSWYSSKDSIFTRPQNISAFYDYYFGNLSMIPDEKQFVVLAEDNVPVGVLDEAFVAEHGEIGTKFVEAGLVWGVKQIYNDRIYVKREEDPVGAIPTWVGEEIPVPLEVAMEVGSIRRIAEERLKQGAPLEEVAAELSKQYPASAETAARALSEVKEHVEKGIPVATDRRATIEQWRDYTIISCYFGHLVNRTLSRLLGHMLSEKKGEAVGVHQDQYRVMLNIVEPVEEIRGLLAKLAKENLSEAMVPSMANTGMFRRRFLHVAKKFGVIEKDADLSSSRLSDLIKSLRDTAVFEEAVKTTLLRDVDMQGTKKVLDSIASGEIQIELLRRSEELSPIARVGMEELGRKADLVPPEKMKRILVQSAKARLLNESKTFVCVGCWNYLENKRVASFQDPMCPLCSSRRIGFVDEAEETIWRLCDAVKSNKGQELAKRYRRLHRRLLRTAELVEKNGFAAVVALVGRGITPSEAASFLGGDKQLSDELVERVLETEKKILRRRYFA